MKAIYAAVFISMACIASEKPYSYEWASMDNGKTNSLAYKTSAPNREIAFKSAVYFCVNFYEKNKNLSEEQRLAVIDLCANPIDKN